jgi:hypothetical protein
MLALWRNGKMGKQLGSNGSIGISEKRKMAASRRRKACGRWRPRGEMANGAA